MSLELINGKKDGFIGQNKIYIGRRNTTYKLKESPLKNPFTTKQGRGNAIDLYKQYLFAHVQEGKGPVYDELVRIAKLYKEGEEVVLACWCAPKPCHGDVIITVIKWLAQKL